VCSLDLEKKRIFTFKEFSQMLDLTPEDVEEWTINAIANGIVEAQLDQIEEQILINSHKLRCLGKEDWQKLKENV
jgi:PCI domain